MAVSFFHLNIGESKFHIHNFQIAIYPSASELAKQIGLCWLTSREVINSLWYSISLDLLKSDYQIFIFQSNDEVTK